MLLLYCDSSSFQLSEVQYWEERKTFARVSVLPNMLPLYLDLGFMSKVKLFTSLSFCYKESCSGSKDHGSTYLLGG
jgi:hypothetical protein